MVNFGDKLKMLRLEKNLTQNGLAKHLNVSKANVSRYELGTRQPNFDTLISISAFFNVSIDWLLGRSTIRNFSSVNDKPRNFEESDLEILEFLHTNSHVHEMLESMPKSKEIRVKIITRIWKEINIDNF
ncbi:helix-turn-helix domain-containing protein [Acetivibrio cellulolyticus]|uniref:helix-turn-helix domain-containing protein n=1 Tax=Acetivibrio cellulolyticus TaxID=35830 RepID=UPI0001E2C2A7|nr:helix-turn-helix domain-containing protein [Acetivibrio cellulolyticus]